MNLKLNKQTKRFQKKCKKKKVKTKYSTEKTFAWLKKAQKNFFPSKEHRFLKKLSRYLQENLSLFYGGIPKKRRGESVGKVYFSGVGGESFRESTTRGFRKSTVEAVETVSYAGKSGFLNGKRYFPSLEYRSSRKGGKKFR